MTVARWIVGALMLVALAYFALLRFGPSDVVESRYDSLQAALADHAWLPIRMPASAYGIRTANNLDMNTSEGEFSYRPQDDPSFASRLADFDATKHLSVAGYADEAKTMQSNGYRVGVIEETPSTWVFYCMQSKGFCKFRMGYERY